MGASLCKGEKETGKYVLLFVSGLFHQKMTEKVTVFYHCTEEVHEVKGLILLYVVFFFYFHSFHLNHSFPT